ncbi:MAG: hypothetical protein K5746_06200 [Clostridiales bacterium]|nr:hypothetical protein [Clostridiales bacterium]
MSVFSGWNRESLAALKEALTGSPEGLAAFALVAIAGFFAIGLVVFFASRQIGGFFLKVREDEERARMEEEEEERASEEEAERALLGEGTNCGIESEREEQP